MFKKINRCDIYIGVWCLYILQDVIYPQGVINQILQLILLLWGMMALYNYLTTIKIRIPILKATFALVLMYVIYGTIHIMFGANTHHLGTSLYLQKSLNSLLPIFSFFLFTRKGFLTRNRIMLYLPIFIVVCSLLFYKNKTIGLINSDAEEITNNVGYMFVSLLPLLFFYDKKPILQYFFMALILLFIIEGMKRGAILLGACGIIILLYDNLRNSRGWSKFFVIFLSVLFVFVAARYLNEMIRNSAYFALRIEQTMEGNASGRDSIYNNLWSVFLVETNIFYVLFGRGADSTLRLVGLYAHQDWLETFCNNGIIGVVLLFNFFYRLGYTILRNRKRFSNSLYWAFVTLFFIICGKTMFSMSIQNMDLPQTLLLGYLASNVYQSNYQRIYDNVQLRMLELRSK